ncbi:hypothetical protein ACWEO4_39910 [Streptomyces sp. NPDC004393]
MGLHWAWHALAVAGACRMTAVAFDAVVRRVVRTASQARDEQHMRARVSAPPPALPAGPRPDTGIAVPPPAVEEQ